MRFILISTFACLSFACFAGEDAAALRQQGIAALKESEANPRAIVAAAKAFAGASELYATAGDESKTTEITGTGKKTR